jgi:hypothetical protein
MGELMQIFSDAFESGVISLKHELTIECLILELLHFVKGISDCLQPLLANIFMLKLTVDPN